MDYYLENVVYKWLLKFSPSQLSMYKLISKSAYTSYNDNIEYYINNTFTPTNYKELCDAIRLYNTDEELAIHTYNHIHYWNFKYVVVNRKELLEVYS